MKPKPKPKVHLFICSISFKEIFFQYQIFQRKNFWCDMMVCSQKQPEPGSIRLIWGICIGKKVFNSFFFNFFKLGSTNSFIGWLFDGLFIAIAGTIVVLWSVRLEQCSNKSECGSSHFFVYLLIDNERESETESESTNQSLKLFKCHFLLAV